MKRWSLLGPAIAAAVVCGCDHRTGIAEADGLLLGEPTAVDFGSVAVHGLAIRRVRVTNVGMASVELRSVSVSGRDADQFEGLAPVGQVLQSGDSAEIEIDMVPTREGPLGAEVDLVSADPSSQTLVVPVAGQAVKALAEFSPAALAFGKVEQGDTRARTLTAVNPGTLPTRAVLVPEGPDAAALRVTPDVLELPPGAQRSISVAWTPDRQQPLDAWLLAVPCPFCQGERIDLTGVGIPYELIAVPPSLDFGAVPKDFSAEKSVTLENVSDQSVQIRAVELGPGSSADFKIDVPVPLPATVPPGGAVPVRVLFLSTSLQSASGEIDVASTDPGRPQLAIPVSGRVGGALIAVAPAVIDFGVVPLGAQPTSQLVIENQGSGANLVVTAATLAGAPQFSLDARQLPASLAPQQKVSLPVYFQPTGTAPVTGTIDVRSNDPLFPDEVVQLVGRARVTQPCVLEMRPPQVDFGSIPPGGGAVLAFHALDVGPDVCVFRHIEIDPASDPGFLLPGGDVNSFVIAPGEFAQAQVAFRPAGPGPARGDVAFTINDPSNPDRQLPLVGNGATPCITASPPWLDFGPVQPGCGSGLDLSTQLTNGCAQPVAVSKVWIGAGTTADFSLASAPPTPAVLQPGGTAVASVHYAATEEGMQAAPLYVAESDVPRPALVPLLAELLPPGLQKDDFVQQSAVREDVLFVVANTGSMRTKIPAVLAGVPDFADALAQSGLDYHVGVTTTGLQPGPDPLWPCAGGAQGGEDGRLFPADGSLPRILDRSAGDLASALEANLQVGFCHYYQQGLQAMALALTPPLSTSAKAPGTPLPADGNAGFLRDDASLAIAVVSDDDDYSGLSEATYLQTLRALSGWGTQRRVSLSALVDVSGCSQDTRVGQRYIDVARSSAGLVEDLCSSDLGPAFSALAQQATGLQRIFPLSQTPQPATIAVTVDGATAPGWSYDASANAVDFPPGGEPPAGSQIEISYVTQCQ